MSTRMGEIFTTTDTPAAINDVETKTPQDAMRFPAHFTVNKWLERPIILPAGTWKAGDIPLGNDPFTTNPDAWMVASRVSVPTTMTDKIKNMKYFRFKSINCTVRVNAQPFHSGLLKLVWSPYEFKGVPTDLYQQRFSLFQINDFENVELDLIKGSSVSLKAPWLKPLEWFPVSEFLQHIGAFYLIPMTALGGPTTSDSVQFSVILNLEGVEVAGPTSSTLAFRPESGTMLDWGDESLVFRPQSGTILESGNNVSTPGGRANTDVNVTSPLGPTPAQETEQKFDFNTLTSSWSYFHRAEWKVGSDSTIGSFSLRPQVDWNLMKEIPALNDTVEPQTLNVNIMGKPAFVARNFLFWRGDFKIRFKFPRSVYHSGSLLAIFEPTSQSVLRANMMTSYTLLMDMKDEPEDCYTLTIPYHHFAPWRPTSEPVGAVTLIPFNTLVAPSTVQQTINVLVEYCFENAEFKVPVETPFRPASVSPSAEANTPVNPPTPPEAPQTDESPPRTGIPFGTTVMMGSEAATFVDAPQGKFEEVPGLNPPPASAFRSQSGEINELDLPSWGVFRPQSGEMADVAPEIIPAVSTNPDDTITEEFTDLLQMARTPMMHKASVSFGIPTNPLFWPLMQNSQLYNNLAYKTNQADAKKRPIAGELMTWFRLPFLMSAYVSGSTQVTLVDIVPTVPKTLLTFRDPEGLGTGYDLKRAVQVQDGSAADGARRVNYINTRLSAETKTTIGWAMESRMVPISYVQGSHTYPTAAPPVQPFSQRFSGLKKNERQFIMLVNGGQDLKFYGKLPIPPMTFTGKNWLI